MHEINRRFIEEIKVSSLSQDEVAVTWHLGSVYELNRRYIEEIKVSSLSLSR